MEWVPTAEQKADYISRATPISEITLRPHWKTALALTFAPTVDLFATAENRLTDKIDYYARYPEAQTNRVNGLSISTKIGDVIYAFPPKPLRKPALNVTKTAEKVIYVYNYDGKTTTAELTAYLKVKRKP